MFNIGEEISVRFIKRKITVFLVCTMFFSILIITPVSSQDWPMFRQNLERTGISTSTTSETNNTLWTYTTTGWFFSSPVVVDGKVYIGTKTREMLICLNENGTLDWEQDLNGEILSTPAVTEDKIVVGSRDGNVYCLDKTTGEINWEFLTGGQVDASPAIYNDYVYINSYDETLYCLFMSNGTEKWSHPSISAISSPTLFNGKIYIGSSNGKLLCINSVNGTLEWDLELDSSGLVLGSPAIKANFLYTGIGGLSEDPKVYCVDLNDKTIEWTYPISSKITSSPAVDDNNVYIAIEEWPNGRLLCLDKTSEFQWEFQTSESTSSSPSITDGKVFFGSDDDHIYCLDSSNGREIWSYNTGFDVVSSPAIADEKVFIASKQGSTVYCFRENNPPTKPGKPTGPSEGTVGSEYTYSVLTTPDADGDTVYWLFDWGDGNNSGWIETLSASYTWLNDGSYTVRAKARDQYGAESGWSPTHIVTIRSLMPQLPQLKITVPHTVFEEEVFQVTVTSQGSPIENVLILFLEEISYTDHNGIVNLNAPSVEDETEYTIIANKTNYQNDTEIITVLNQELEADTGWVFGIVTDVSGIPLENTQVCITFEDSMTIRCTTTDNQGTYQVQVPTGLHSIEASKTGYQSQGDTIIIEANSALEQNFILQEEIQKPVLPSSFQEEVITYALQTGIVGTEINIDAQENEQVTLYTEINVDIQQRPSEQAFSFIISGEDEEPGTVFILKIENINTFFNTDTVDITDVLFSFDGESVEKADFSRVIDADEETPTWTGFIIDDTLYVLGWIPHFSEHTITVSVISEIVEILTSPFAILLYVSILIIGSFFFIGPVVSIAIRNKLKRKHQ